ncbi:PAS domain S-box protein [Mesorhizobium sp. ES1-1]|uniref:PAS domain S-box protein n=1 Tax=Mesorhizobium sp. ES1-1 TaxID=2876629 RepID=UPI001CCCBA3C|nr:PAS domain S-box protein [Mesorhizobium sp. ES1-1]MBZ9674461.1 PAS domain S-box protein [Mesorhizobium sp. ES1-1]
MPSEYSFLDVAVLDAVRQRFAAGDAIAILSADLEQVIWANGPGAALFGYPDIEAIIGASAQLPLIARRQIMATSGFPEIGLDRATTVRLATGMTSRAVGFLASAVTMPDAEKAIMLVVPVAYSGSRGAHEIAARAISGFTEDGHFIAFVDANGKVEAASEGFSALGILPETLAALVADVAGESDRIVKRLVPGRTVSYPAGMARLTEERHLLVVIDEDQLDDATDGRSAKEEASLAAVEAPEELPARPVADQDNKPALDVAALVGAADPVLPEETETSQAPDRENAVERAAEKADNDAGAAGSMPAQHDHWYFNADEDVAQPAGRQAGSEVINSPDAAPGMVDDDPAPGDQAPLAAAQPPAQRSIDRTAAPLRFVWRTDADGKFSALSREFADIVGQQAADVIGRRFKDVAATFGLDPSGEISALLDRRDTWSGRTVLWPVVGTDLKIPVDLAALPVYGRSRAFEGFRGFGVARAGDAVVDPEAIGMALVPNSEVPAERQAPANEAAPEEPKTDEPGEASDPFKGEVPALTIVPKPERRFADKVIRLAEHRQPANDKGLSTLERSAFREIGERLKKDSSPLEAEKLASAPQEQAPVVPAITQEEIAVEATGDTVPAHDVSPEKLADFSAIPGMEAASEPALASPAGIDAEDEQDLARIDGGHPRDAADRRFADTLPHAAGSLVGSADREETGPVTDNNGIPVTEPVAAEQEGVEPAAAGDDEAKKAPGDVDDDSMTSADFRDAEDSEEWIDREEAVAADDRGSDDLDVASATEADAVDELMETAVEPPRRLAPPLKVAGFVPSAFSTGDESRAPDTSLLAKLPVPLLIHSGDQLHYANDEFLSLTGYATLQSLGDAGGLGALFADPYADDGASDGSDRALRLKTRDGQEFPIEAILRSVPWRDGKALMLVVRRSGEDEAPAALHAVGEEQTQPDISELKARIAEMRTIIDTATDGVVLIGRDGIIRSISRPAEALFGFDSDEVTGKPFASLFAIESQRAARDYLNGLSEPGVASVMNDGREVIGREAQGRFIPLFMTIGRLPNDSGFCAVVRDITQWKRAEEDLTQARAVAERASSQKTDFLARISHEIRTPLNAIIGFSELMVDEKFGPVANDRYRDYLRDINRSGNHVLDLVNDLLDISKIEAGQQEMAYEAVSLNDTLAETVAMMQPQANRERVIIRSSFASRLPEVVADLRSVRQIALNILSNAIRYTQAGGQVIVSTAYETSGDVVMRVRDTGIGMSQAEIEQAMKPFKQINALKRGRGDGTGLGLPLTKAMVEANRARFTINSTPGEGTLVEIAFPSTRVLAQ